MGKVLIEYEFTADRIYNFYESGITTVLSMPKVLAKTSKEKTNELLPSNPFMWQH